MDLFTPVVPPDKQHPNFAQTIIANRHAERAIVQGWAEGFPDRDNKFVREFQTSFNSSFWEVYLHGLFREYGFTMDWSQASPDFHLRTPQGEVILEAVTANAADGATPEWERASLMTEPVIRQDFWPLNRASIIRLANALLSKLRKYRESYQRLPHVGGKPFVMAVAPFEQPDFQQQYDRAMRALLYDDYVDESAYFANPHAFPNGPPSVSLGSVQKDNGATIDMGIFINQGWEEVSAVMFSCVATWGKSVAMSTVPKQGMVWSSWGSRPDGRPAARQAQIGMPSETISDGLQIFHNPYARRPLPLEVFRRQGVVQHYLSPEFGWQRENYDDCLQFRTTHTFNVMGEDIAPDMAAGEG